MKNYTTDTIQTTDIFDGDLKSLFHPRRTGTWLPPGTPFLWKFPVSRRRASPLPTAEAVQKYPRRTKKLSQLTQPGDPKKTMANHC
jgi:hypothetical protein